MFKLIRICRDFFSVFILSLCSLLFLPRISGAQSNPGHLRVSLLTVSPGDEIYASFGHTGIRITDSVSGTDVVYNYGTFNGFDKDFEWKFMRGKLLYYESYETFQTFIATYIDEQRTVQEQEILLNSSQKRELYDFLINNAKEENKYYKYDYLYDNCATRIRDVFPKTFGAGFKYGQTLPPGHLTFRQIEHVYLRKLHWERFGIDLLLGRAFDVTMSNETVMFLPDYLRNGIGNATVSGQKVATAPVTLLQGPADNSPVGPDGPLWLMLGICLLTILGLSVPKLHLLGAIMSNLLLIVSGLIGCLILFMMFGTDHQGCRDNWNVLWALPTNIFVPCFRRKGRDRYAVIAIILLLAVPMLYAIRFQGFPMYELWPLLLSLLCIFGMIYRRGMVKQ